MEENSTGSREEQVVEPEYDVTLLIDDQQFQCKKKVLAENSDYFKAMFYNDFIEKNKDVVELQDVDPPAMDVVLKSLDNQSPDFSKCSIILNVLETSCMLHFDIIKVKCIQFIIDHWMDYKTWLPVVTVARKLGLIDLQHKAESLAFWNFSKVKKTESFLDLSSSELIDYLDNDGLRVTESEFEVFEAGCNWIDKNPDERLFYSLNILHTIRFKEMSTFDIKSMLHYSTVRDTPQMELIIECILEIRDGVLNQSCEACNVVIEDEDSQDAPDSPQSPLNYFSSSSTFNNSFRFMKSFKRKRRTTSQCTCFDTCTITTAQKLLEKQQRILPLIPCFVGSVPFKNYKDDPKWTPRENLTSKHKWPYLFQWNQHDCKPIPFLHIAKIDEGPSEAMGYKVVVKDFKLYVIGGEYMMGYGDWNTSVWKYDTLRDTWYLETSLPSPRRHHSACILNNDLYIIGGVGKYRVMLNSVVKYSLDKKDWQKCESLPMTLYSTACCVYKEEIFLFGPQVMCFRPRTNMWEVMNDIVLPGNVAVATALTHNNLIYFIAVGVPNLYCFEPYLETIVFEHLGKFESCGKDACIVNNSIYSFGEEDDNQTVEVFKINSREFGVLWKANGTDGILMHQGAGCFPLPKYF